MKRVNRYQFLSTIIFLALVISALVAHRFIAYAADRKTALSESTPVGKILTAAVVPQDKGLTTVAVTNGKVAFVRDGNRIYTMNADGGGVAPLFATHIDAESEPAWSPDGSKLAFVSGTNNGNQEIYIFDTNGSVLTRLTTDASGTVFNDISPAWSPNGNKIAWKRPAINGGGYDIFTMDAVDLNADGDGDNRVQITNLAVENNTPGRPSWSPDGTKIAFTRSFAGGSNQLAIMKADGSNQTPVTSSIGGGPNADADAAWSPDGSKIAFRRGVNGAPQILIANVDGSGSTQLTNNVASSQKEPAWSPDGTKIVFNSDQIDGSNKEVYVMNADGSNQTRLTSYAGTDEWPTWQAVSLVTISGQVRNANSLGVPDIVLVFEQQLTSGGSVFTDSLPTDANGNYSQTVNSTTIAQGGTFNFRPLVDGYVTTTGQSFYTVVLTATSADIMSKDFVPEAAPSPSPSPSPSLSPSPSPSPSPDCVAPLYTMVHWYRGEGDATDIVNHTNGRLNGGAAFAAAKVGQAFSFSGAGGYVETAQTQVLNNLPVTIEAWVKPSLRNDGIDFPANTVSNDRTGEFGHGFGLNVFAGGSQLKVEYSDGVRVIPGVSFDADQWYHIAVAYSAGNVRTYVNGVDVDDFDFTQGSTNGLDRILIGRHEIAITDGTRNSFRGLIDEISVYTAKLPLGSVSEIFQAGSAGKCIPPPAPANDNIQNSQLLSGTSNTVFGTNAGATRQIGTFRPDLNLPDEPQHVVSKPGGRSIWYKWTAPANGELALDTWNSGFDTLLAVYRQYDYPALFGFSPAFSFFAPVASNDDTGQHNNESYVRLTVDKGVTYFIAVDGYKGKTGNINLRYAFYQSQPAPPGAIVSGMTPTVACTNDSDPAGFCSKNFDLDGFFVLRLTGRNFTKDSEVIINRQSLSGFDRAGNAVNGYTTFINSGELEAHIPPSPPLNFATSDKVEVARRISAASALTSKFQPNTFASLLAGSYLVASNIALLDVIELKNAVVPAGGQSTVCGNTPFNKPDEESCITYTNFENRPMTVSTTYFLATIQCATKSANFAEQYRCLNTTLGLVGSDAFSINPEASNFAPTDIIIKQRFIGSPDQQIAGNINSLTQLMVQGGQILATDGATIVAGGAGNIVAGGAGNIIAGGAGNIIAGGAGNILATDGATFSVGSAGSNFVLSGNAQAAGNAQTVGAASSGPRPIAQVNSIADLSTKGSSGWFIAHGSGGSRPVVETIDDPVTGEAVTTIQITLDMTSNPRASDVRGLAFAFAIAPPIIQLDSNNITVDEGAGGVNIKVVRTGNTTGAASVDYATSDGTAAEAKNYSSVFGSLVFAPGETEKTVRVQIIDDAYGAADEGTQNNFLFIIGNQSGAAVLMPNVATITINNNDAITPPTNPVSDSQFFVRQNYLDFLSREPDASGLAFWTNQITECGTDAACIDIRRTNVSAAFFLSIEFQETGFLVARLHAATFGGELPTSVKMRDFLAETQSIGRGVIVGQSGWEAVLEANRLTFLDAWVNRSDFIALYAGKTNEEFVNTLFANGGVAASEEATLRAQLIQGLNDGTDTRATALRKIVNSQTFSNKLSNPSFVLMQYFGYLRRNPNDAPDTDFNGYHFWLSKLNQFDGNFINAEMVRAFILSGEYRSRFGRN